ncbi:hypothetical protein SSX86_002207 [Deinandra increscens subsp. villosa]|uniref:Uncharacterized protein n=1 Tax=Deinandra increscens subsp. villosa TaxID=3103831 RepID=A0AAP0HCX5_9ASTR
MEFADLYTKITELPVYQRFGKWKVVGYFPDIEIWKEVVEGVPKQDLKQVLTECAGAVSNNDFSTSQRLISELQQVVSVSGEPIQRLGAYMLEGLVARLSESGSSICKQHVSRELLSYTNILYKVCLCFKFGYMSANGAIAEAMKDENRVHIIECKIGEGSQWVSLIQTFAARHGGRLVYEQECEHRGPPEQAKRMRPKVVTLVEQEPNTNTTAFYPRFVEALDYYNAMFESMDARPPHENNERINVERHCLAKGMVNAIACEGDERVERHELVGKWRLRFMMAGFNRTR